MKEVFSTFRPQKKIIQKYVAYYYLDIKESNKINQFEYLPLITNTPKSFFKKGTVLGKRILFGT